MSALGVLTLAEVCKTPAAHLGELDVAVLNLLCAQGLPHSEDIDLGRISDWLDDAAREVELVTVEPSRGRQPPPWGVPATDILGIGAGNGSPPDDETVKQWIREHRTEVEKRNP